MMDGDNDDPLFQDDGDGEDDLFGAINAGDDGAGGGDDDDDPLSQQLDSMGLGHSHNGGGSGAVAPPPAAAPPPAPQQSQQQQQQQHQSHNESDILMQSLMGDLDDGDEDLFGGIGGSGDDDGDGDLFGIDDDDDDELFQTTVMDQSAATSGDGVAPSNNNNNALQRTSSSSEEQGGIVIATAPTTHTHNNMDMMNNDPLSPNANSSAHPHHHQHDNNSAMMMSYAPTGEESFYRTHNNNNNNRESAGVAQNTNTIGYRNHDHHPYGHASPPSSAPRQPSSQPTASSSTATPPSSFQVPNPAANFTPTFSSVVVTDPKYVSEGGGSLLSSLTGSSTKYWSYTVTSTQSSLPPYKTFTVQRRFRHFDTLQDRLRQACPGAILPSRYVQYGRSLVRYGTPHHTSDSKRKTSMSICSLIALHVAHSILIVLFCSANLIFFYLLTYFSCATCTYFITFILTDHPNTRPWRWLWDREEPNRMPPLQCNERPNCIPT
jgi:hypothetical protein